ncbi:hypothetical protein APED_06905 [Acanthopleuribacter pedis]
MVDFPMFSPLFEDQSRASTIVHETDAMVNRVTELIQKVT